MNKMELGLIVGVPDDPRVSFEKVLELGIPTCQLTCTAERLVDKLDPNKIRRAADELGIEISSFFLLFEGQRFDLKDGPATMGLVPESFREKRLKLAKRFSDMVVDLGVRSITSHIGFIPDDPHDPIYIGFLDVMKELAEHCGNNGQIFCFETGQELPSTLKRTIRDVGTGNLFVNLDPANLILYGMAHPLDAVEIFGEYVRGMHAKDGVWPNRDEVLGRETPLGEGKVNFPLLIPRLKEKGFEGPITIEREITGPEQRMDILKAKALLEPML
ncbi:MAG: sugar phosphate isomerase/epimerase [Candidatus Latescibacteria bacterium]|nr:sugar phosphate isomerase/epimerase [Candidatus Latescibacterota bacterium]